MTPANIAWDNTKSMLKEIDELYSLKETQRILSNNGYYKTFFGKAKNRTMIKQDPKLYKSVMTYSQPLEDVMVQQGRYKGSYNFRYRLMFIVELNCDVNELKCDCGKTYGWTPYCRECPEPKRTWVGRKHSTETLHKMRQSTLAYIHDNKGQVSPRYNKSSIPIIEAKARELGITDLQHAENGGEFQVLGYFVDGYSAEKNIVIEYDERQHFRNGKLTKKDARRQREIEEHLGCTFIRIKDGTV
jgi:hypothetical protein